MSSRKACTGCGALNTPQWREGPYGPRTLCNACGVRYLRRDCGRPSDRKAQVKQARRKAHTAPGLRDDKAPKAKCKAEASIKHKQKQSSCHVHRLGSSLRVKEQSQPSQQSVQEQYWESGSTSDACQSSQPTVEDAAAANLIAMSKPNAFTGQTGACCGDAWIGAKDSSNFAGEEDSMSSQLQACEQLDSSEAELQAQFLSDLAAMREEVEAAEKKLAAATAAADAVSQVLSTKQAAVTAAWAVMVSANQRLQQHIKQEPDFGDTNT